MSIITPRLSQVLPYDPSQKKGGTELKASLNEYSLLLTALEEAIEALRRGDFEQFDALVGDNACQIRAVKIAECAPAYIKALNSLQDQIVRAKENIQKLPSSLDKLGRKNFRQLLDEKGLDIELSSDELFLIKCYLLFVTKKPLPPNEKTPLCGNEESVSKNLLRFGAVSQKSAQRLVDETRKSLSKDSVVYVRELANSLNDEQLIKICSDAFTSKQIRTCIPMFWTYKTLLLAAEQRKLPLILNAKFVVKGQEKTIVDEESIYLNAKSFKQTAIIIDGFVCREQLPSKQEWIAEIKSQGLFDVVLAGAADHRQYPDEKIQEVVEILKKPEFKDPEFEGYKQLAKEKGYSFENPSQFFIQHVYARTVGKQLLRSIFSEQPLPNNVISQIAQLYLEALK